MYSSNRFLRTEELGFDMYKAEYEDNPAPGRFQILDFKEEQIANCNLKILRSYI